MGLQALTIPEDPQCTFINKHNRTLQISLHICLNGNGTTGMTEAGISGALQRLNTDFAPSGLQFEYCIINTMENYEFDTLTVNPSINEETHMTVLHYEPNTINVYLVDLIYNGTSVDPDGYTYMPSSNKDIIVISKNFFNQGWGHFSHQMGHFLGLYHTYETTFGVEHPSGSNCDTSGDLVCDTRADPGGQSNPQDQCNYSGPAFEYSPGVWYVPPTDNLMSTYYSGAAPAFDCRCRFTPQQYNRMVQQYLAYRGNLR